MPAASSFAASRRSHVCSSVNRLNNIIFPASCCHLQKSPHMPAGSCHSASCHVTSVLSTSHGSTVKLLVYRLPYDVFTLTSDARVPALSWHTAACLLPHTHVLTRDVQTCVNDWTPANTRAPDTTPIYCHRYIFSSFTCFSSSQTFHLDILVQSQAAVVSG